MSEPLERLAFQKPDKPVRDPRFRAAYKRAHPICEACGKRRTYDFHHIISKARGGSDTEENGLALCRPCHDGWANVNKTRREWFAEHEATMSDDTREKVMRALRIENDDA